MARFFFRTGVLAAFLCTGMLPVNTWASDDDVSATVRTFYTRYISENSSADLSSHRQIDKSYIDKIAAMKARAAQEDPDIGGLDFDPVIWGQDVPGNFDVKTDAVQGDSAMATVSKMWSGEKEASSWICVSLKKKAGAWKIVDTVDPAFFKKKDCRSFKPGAMFPDIM